MYDSEPWRDGKWVDQAVIDSNVKNVYAGMQCPRCRVVCAVDEVPHRCTNLFTPFQMHVVATYGTQQAKAARLKSWQGALLGGGLGGLIALVLGLVVH